MWPTEQVLAAKAKVREQRDLEYRDESPVETVVVAVVPVASRMTGVLTVMPTPQRALVTDLAQSARPGRAGASFLQADQSSAAGHGWIRPVGG